MYTQFIIKAKPRDIKLKGFWSNADEYKTGTVLLLNAIAEGDFQVINEKITSRNSREVFVEPI